jgi:hypothetical protein
MKYVWVGSAFCPRIPHRVTLPAREIIYPLQSYKENKGKSTYCIFK